MLMCDVQAITIIAETSMAAWQRPGASLISTDESCVLFLSAVSWPLNNHCARPASICVRFILKARDVNWLHLAIQV